LKDLHVKTLHPQLLVPVKLNKVVRLFGWKQVWESIQSIPFWRKKQMELMGSSQKERRALVLKKTCNWKMTLGGGFETFVFFPPGSLGKTIQFDAYFSTR